MNQSTSHSTPPAHAPAAKAQPKNEKMKPIFIAFGIIMAVIIIVGGAWYIDMLRFVSTDDARVTADNIHVSSKIPGKIKTILVDEGQTVAFNDTLALIDKTDLEITFKQAKANFLLAQVKLSEAQKAAAVHTTSAQEISISKSKMDIAKIAMDHARSDLDRAKRMFASNYISDRDYQNAIDASSTAEKNYQAAVESYDLLKENKTNDLKKAELTLDQAREAMDQAQAYLDYTVIQSPAAGVVAMKASNPGEYITPGQSLFIVINSEKVWIQANIKETDISRIHLGSQVRVKIDALGNKSFHGKVKEIGVATNSNFALLPASNGSGSFVKVVQSVPLKIELSEPVPGLKVGSSATVKIKT